LEHLHKFWLNESNEPTAQVKLNSDFNGVAQDYIKKYLRLLFVGFFQAQPQVEKLNVYSNESGRRVMNKVA
jgi:hypothetical protein